MPRPKFEPTAEQRKMVEAMAAYGVPEIDIARTIGPKGIDPKTLRKHFRRELSTAATRATAKVAESLYQMACSGNHPGAAIFWMKCRGGWKENRGLEAYGTGNGKDWTDAELDKQITDELARVATAGSAAGIPAPPDGSAETAPAVHVGGLEGAA